MLVNISYCVYIPSTSNIKQLENNNISCGLQVLITKENLENDLALSDKITNKDLILPCGIYAKVTKA